MGMGNNMLHLVSNSVPREWFFNAYDGSEGLSLKECDREEPKATEARIRIEASAFNWSDSNLLLDQYSFSFSDFSARFAMKAAGMVEELGSHVKGIVVGDCYLRGPRKTYGKIVIKSNAVEQ